MFINFLVLIAQACYFILPAGVANMVPVLVRKLPIRGAFPIHKKHFGANKTRRGIYTGILGSILMVYIQTLLIEIPFFGSISLIEYGSISPVIYGILFGAGALLGDLVESFIKRRKNMPPGTLWLPWDQIDWIIGAVLLSLIVIVLPIEYYIIIFALLPVAHVISNIIGYLTGFKDVWR